MRGTASEAVLHPELDHAAVVGTRDRPEVGRARARDRLTKARMVEQVVRLDADLDLVGLREREALEQRHVDPVEAGAADGVARLVAGARGGRRDGAPLEAARVEPLLYG